MRIFFFFLILITPLITQGENGTSGDPFTAIGQAWHVPASGIYHFRIAGTNFSTYVEAGNGWVMIASGNAATTEASYAIVSNLTLQSDKILPSSIYTSPIITAVRINATSGPTTPFDVQSSNATILTNLRNNRTLSVGSTAAMWTGTGTARLSLSCGTSNTTLNLGIYHSGCMATNLHWAVSQNTAFEKVDHNSATKNNLNLWVRATSVTLPIELLNFKATLNYTSHVQLNWQTSKEVNNNYFIIQRSKDGLNWDSLTTIKGSGNSSSIITYQAIDNNPNSGISYYRVKQYDFNGLFSYSPIQSVYKSPKREQIQMYPNPAFDQLAVEGEEQEIDGITIYNFVGDEVTKHVEILGESASIIKIDVSKLIPGMYVVKTKTSAKTIYKQ